MTTDESDARAVKNALRALVDGGAERTGRTDAALVSAAAAALSDVERAAAAAEAGEFERVRAAERAAKRRGDDTLAERCREVLDALAAYRRAAADGSPGTDSGDAGLMSGDTVSSRHE